MKTSRISLYRMLRPVALFAFLAFCATALTSIVLLPAANTALKAHLFNMVKSRAMVGIEAGVFNNSFDGMVIYVDKMESLDRMEGIFIADERSAKDPYSIVAKRGKLITDPQSFKVTLAMEEGAMYSMPRDDSKYHLTSFAAGNIFLDINRSLLPGASPATDYRDASLRTLLADIRSLRAQGKPTFRIESELHQRLSIPVACLIFGIIGAPLGIRRSRSGRSSGIAIALACSFSTTSDRHRQERGRDRHTVATPSGSECVSPVSVQPSCSISQEQRDQLGIVDRVVGCIPASPDKGTMP
jgi:lipopolysaccharide export system permease protein